MVKLSSLLSFSSQRSVRANYLYSISLIKANQHLWST